MGGARKGVTSSGRKGAMGSGVRVMERSEVWELCGCVVGPV